MSVKRLNRHKDQYAITPLLVIHKSMLLIANLSSSKTTDCTQDINIIGAFNAVEDTVQCPPRSDESRTTPTD